MKKLRLEEILPPIEGVIVKEGLSSSIDRVVTRRKLLKAQTLFFCLDRNLKDKSIEEPFPPCVIVTDRVRHVRNSTGDATIVEVKNVKEAYKKFLTFYRNLFSFPIVAITGTYGKTTTKEMIKHILLEDYEVKATKGNYNLFRSNSSVLTSFGEETDFGLFEFGIGKPGNLEKCCHCFGPFSAIITGIGADHIERYGNQQRYMEEKAKILQGVGDHQVAILNSDCMNSRQIGRTFNKKILWFGVKEEADYKADHVKYSKDGMEFMLTHGPHVYSVYVPGYGSHNVSNALAAIAASHAHGVNLEDAVNRLRTFRPLRRHLQMIKGINGSTLIDDSWNTNSGSIEAALTVLNQISTGKKTIAVLGRISELGEEEESEHQKIGRIVYQHHPDQLITIGSTASIIAKEALEQGMNPNNIRSFNEPESALSFLHEIADPETIILVKASMRDSFRSFVKNLKPEE
ncbi:Mur ligase family protein [Halobacillus halophilus]|uniref:Mur ligase family protein n=1 Tax=Halobacillus halophilus TaxID=1570 RepID=UPI001CD63255|nr:Mur ligase family protein [Halobacillus halophilus]MCA1011485.1 hypothetical protein [Halobacillus halophilus]